MAFEPLQTDEKLTKAVKTGPDMDTQMIGGCSGFVGSALITYALGIWPFFLFNASVHLLAQLLLSSLLGLIPASVFGAIVGRRWGLAPACGFFGGAITVAVFLYLSLNQVAMGHTIADLPRPDYPAAFAWLLPLAWILFALVVTAFFAQMGERRRTKSPRIRR